MQSTVVLSVSNHFSCWFYFQTFNTVLF